MTSPEVPPRVVHASPALRVTFDGDGVALAAPWSRPVRVGWAEIGSVCVTPEMVRGPEGWREAPNALRRGPSVLERSGARALELGVVVCDRRPILARTRGAGRVWLNVKLRGMLDAGDRPKDDAALLRLRLRRDRLQGSLDELLDLVSARSRFELVATV